MEMKTGRLITGGLYLVVDPSLERQALLAKLRQALEEPVVAVQIFDQFAGVPDAIGLVKEIGLLCHAKQVPALLNNHWEWLPETDLDGVHFDLLPESMDEIRKQVNRPFMTGVTCNNDLSVIVEAIRQQVSYISFCSIFPSTTSNSCELVQFDTIREARRLTDMPIFLAGGIRPGNMGELKELPYDGVAVVSGIMSADDPQTAIRQYLKQLKTIST